jgi:hypothetical protein
MPDRYAGLLHAVRTRAGMGSCQQYAQKLDRPLGGRHGAFHSGIGTRTVPVIAIKAELPYPG